MEGLGFNSRYHKKSKIPNKQLNMRKQIRGVKKKPHHCIFNELHTLRIYSKVNTCLDFTLCVCLSDLMCTTHVPKASRGTRSSRPWNWSGRRL